MWALSITSLNQLGGFTRCSPTKEAGKPQKLFIMGKSVAVLTAKALKARSFSSTLGMEKSQLIVFQP